MCDYLGLGGKEFKVRHSPLTARHGGNTEIVFSRYSREDTHKLKGVEILFKTPEKAQVRKISASSREVDMKSHNYKRGIGSC